MEQLMKLNLLFILKGQLDNSSDQLELETAYDEFAVKLQEKLQSEVNISKLYYSLGLIRLELVGIQDVLSNSKEKKHFKDCC